MEGAFQLATAVQAFPDGTVHLGVVDPGVGTERRAIAVLDSGSVFIGPDNGLLSLALTPVPDRVVELSSSNFHRATVTPTFHGRDIFAPAAALLASGRVSLADLGRELDQAAFVRLNIEPVDYGVDEVRGPVISIDRFGNCLTLIDPDLLEGLGSPPTITCRKFITTGLSRTYADQPDGHPVALTGSHGGLELAVRGGNASEAFGVRRGDEVTVRGPGALSVDLTR
jgi:hypothetical protein